MTTMGKLWWVKITMHGYTMDDVPERHKKSTQAVFDAGGLK